MCADRVLEMGEENRVVFQKPFHNPDYKLRKFEDIARILSGARVSNLGLLTGERTYYLTGVIAELEQVGIHIFLDLIADINRYTFSSLIIEENVCSFKSSPFR